MVTMKKWYITIAVEKEDKSLISNNKPQIGMDLGITNYAALSDDTIKQNAKITTQQRNHLKILAQGVSRKIYNINAVPPAAEGRGSPCEELL